MDLCCQLVKCEHFPKQLQKVLNSDCVFGFGNCFLWHLVFKRYGVTPRRFPQYLLLRWSKVWTCWLFGRAAFFFFFCEAVSVCSVHRLKRGWVTGWNLFTLTVCVIARPREEQTLLVCLLNQPNSHVNSFIYCHLFSRASTSYLIFFSKPDFHSSGILLYVTSIAC